MLSRSNEYAIRALTYLARSTDSRLFLAREIAEELGMPAPFLGKVLQPLVAKGIIQSQRGRSGGFRLARPASEVRLIEIVEAQESLGPENVCLLGQHTCDDATACPMHEYWKKASSAFRERISKTTLADLLRFADTHSNCAYPHQEEGSTTARPTLMMGARTAV
ncbi:MAG: Rrf2 family transcriptional regulator [Planctomycetota bacterium]|nr:Rrf2 family transcriptional regulator [Planctomycetota bacterium]